MRKSMGRIQGWDGKDMMLFLGKLVYEKGVAFIWGWGYYNNNITVQMSMEDLELRLLEQQHLKKMLLLQKERLLLGKENILPKTKVEQEKASRVPIKPYFKEDAVLEKMIYQGYKPSNEKPRLKYPLEEIDAKIAQKQINSILGFWNCQTKM